MEITGFLPIENQDAEILILGSVPSVKSLEENQYYGHPRNVFWDIMGDLFGFERNLGYEKRAKILLKNKLALWDVLSGCERQGSLDSSIKTKSIVTNDFQTFFEKHPSVNRVFFNGTKAENEYNKRVLPKLSETLQNIKYCRLPSTSPAMASLNKAAKLAEWKIIKTEK